MTLVTGGLRRRHHISNPLRDKTHFTFDVNPPERFWEVTAALDDPGSLDIKPACTNISYMRRFRKKEFSSEHQLLLYTYLLS